MKSVAVILMITGLALGCVGVAVFGMNDSRVLTPPPDAVASEFSRQILQGRSELVRPLLSRSARQRERMVHLRGRVDPVRQTIGRLDSVTAERASIVGNQAHARALLQGDNGSAVLSFAFVREHGLWVIDEWRRE